MQLSVQKRSVEDFEELKGVVPTACTEVTQVDAGRLEGKLSHYLVGDLPLDLASFSLDVRSRGRGHFAEPGRARIDVRL
jgi:hypothetical protein